MTPLENIRSAFCNCGVPISTKLYKINSSKNELQVTSLLLTALRDSPEWHPLEDALIKNCGSITVIPEHGTLRGDVVF